MFHKFNDTKTNFSFSLLDQPSKLEEEISKASNLSNSNIPSEPQKDNSINTRRFEINLPSIIEEKDEEDKITNDDSFSSNKESLKVSKEEESPIPINQSQTNFSQTLLFQKISQELIELEETTVHNTNYLKSIYLEYLDKFKKLLNKNLSDDFNMNFLPYGSLISGLGIEGSDLDIRIFYERKNGSLSNDKSFTQSLLNVLIENQNFLKISKRVGPIVTSKFTLIQLEIDLSEKINLDQIKWKSYFSKEEIKVFQMDITISEYNEQDADVMNKNISYIKENLNKYPEMKKVVFFSKRYLKNLNLNKNMKGGLNSFSTFLLALVIFKNKSKDIERSSSEWLYIFFEFWANFNFDFYSIDVENEKSIFIHDINKDKQIVIKDPVDKKYTNAAHCNGYLKSQQITNINNAFLDILKYLDYIKVNSNSGFYLGFEKIFFNPNTKNNDD